MKKCFIIFFFIFCLLKGIAFSLTLSEEDYATLKEYANTLEIDEKDLYILSSFLVKIGESDENISPKTLGGIQGISVVYNFLDILSPMENIFLNLKEKGYIDTLPKNKADEIFIAGYVYDVFYDKNADDEKKSKDQKKSLDLSNRYFSYAEDMKKNLDWDTLEIIP